MKSNKELLREILSRLDSLDYVKPEQIPDIPLYMDQLTTFMDERLEKSKRYPEDKVLTKTMNNNYAKNNLLPPPNKKKYTKEHTLLLIFIYYFKNMLSFHDIETLFAPITEEHFAPDKVSSTAEGYRHKTENGMGANDSNRSLEDIYQEMFSLEKEQMKRLKEDITRKFRSAMETFQDKSESISQTTNSPCESCSRQDCLQSGSAKADRKESSSQRTDQEYLQLFSFICALGFDVYLKKQIIEYLIDQIREEYPQTNKKKK